MRFLDFSKKFDKSNFGLNSVESTQQSTDDMVESAATIVKDTAGAVKNLAQSLLRAITPELGKGGESPQNLQHIKVKNLFFCFHFPIIFAIITRLEFVYI